MDWIQLGESASRLLSAMLRFGVNEVDANSLMTVANEGNPAWSADPALRRQMFQALELLDRESLVSRGTSGNLRLTEAGRAALSEPPLAWMPDPASPSTREWIELEDLHEAMDAERPSNELTIARMSVSNWRQFDSVDLLIHPRLTVLTGANASGKTTLLNLLAPHFNWNAQLVSMANERTLDGSPAAAQVGQVRYSNGVRANLLATTWPRNFHVECELYAHGASIRNLYLITPVSE
jgi:hypothetical protein